MQSIVIFAVGSPLVVDYEESARRANIEIVAAIRNTPDEVFFSDPSRVVDIAQAPPSLKRLPVVIPLFTPAHRRSALANAERYGFTMLADLIDPTSILPSRFGHGPGLYINAGCTLGAASQFGRCVLINRGVTIGHHAEFGDFCSVGPGAVIAGNVRIGPGSLVGAGAVVLPKCVIGANVIVGAGAVVTGDVPDDIVVAGNPARIRR